jgi:hypothetical protein
MENNSIVTAVTRTLKTLVDGTVRLNIDFEPSERAQVMELFGEPGSLIAIARLSQEASQVVTQQDYGQQASALHKSGFFQGQQVLTALGTDEQYIEWIHGQASVISKEFSEYPENGPHAGEGRNIAHHVRLVSEGAGTGLKPDYSCIPVTQLEHLEIHNGKLLSHTGQISELYKIRAKWGHQRLLEELNYDSLKKVPPDVIRGWAETNDLLMYLPQEYR